MTDQTKMLVEAGIIPKNTLQQLNHWRLVPEGYVKLHGAHPTTLDTNNPDEVRRFVKDLSSAISKDMAEIRETELNSSGGFKKAKLVFKDPSLNSESCDVFVDRLGRLVVPNGAPWTLLEEVHLEEDRLRRVLKKETRYEGEKAAATIIYLESDYA